MARHRTRGWTTNLAHRQLQGVQRIALLHACARITSYTYTYTKSPRSSRLATCIKGQISCRQSIYNSVLCDVAYISLNTGDSLAQRRLRKILWWRLLHHPQHLQGEKLGGEWWILLNVHAYVKRCPRRHQRRIFYIHLCRYNWVHWRYLKLCKYTQETSKVIDCIDKARMVPKETKLFTSQFWTITG